MVSLSFWLNEREPPAVRRARSANGEELPRGGEWTRRSGGGELVQQMLGARRAIFAGLLDIELLDHAVVDQHRIALRALAHAELAAVEREADRVGEGAVPVGEHGDVVGSILLAPGGHHERIVDRDAGDFVDALAL